MAISAGSYEKIFCRRLEPNDISTRNAKTADREEIKERIQFINCADELDTTDMKKASLIAISKKSIPGDNRYKECLNWPE